MLSEYLSYGTSALGLAGGAAVLLLAPPGTHKLSIPLFAAAALALVYGRGLSDGEDAANAKHAAAAALAQKAEIAEKARQDHASVMISNRASGFEALIIGAAARAAAENEKDTEDAKAPACADRVDDAFARRLRAGRAAGALRPPSASPAVRGMP